MDHLDAIRKKSRAFKSRAFKSRDLNHNVATLKMQWISSTALLRLAREKGNYSTTKTDEETSLLVESAPSLKGGARPLKDDDLILQLDDTVNDTLKCFTTMLFACSVFAICITFFAAYHFQYHSCSHNLSSFYFILSFILMADTLWTFPLYFQLTPGLVHFSHTILFQLIHTGILAILLLWIVYGFSQYSQSLSNCSSSLLDFTSIFFVLTLMCFVLTLISSYFVVAFTSLTIQNPMERLVLLLHEFDYRIAYISFLVYFRNVQRPNGPPHATVHSVLREFGIRKQVERVFWMTFLLTAVILVGFTVFTVKAVENVNSSCNTPLPLFLTVFGVFALFYSLWGSLKWFVDPWADSWAYTTLTGKCIEQFCQWFCLFLVVLGFPLLLMTDSNHCNSTTVILAKGLYYSIAGLICFISIAAVVVTVKRSFLSKSNSDL